MNRRLKPVDEMIDFIQSAGLSVSRDVASDGSARMCQLEGDRYGFVLSDLYSRFELGKVLTEPTPVEMERVALLLLGDFITRHSSEIFIARKRMAQGYADAS